MHILNQISISFKTSSISNYYCCKFCRKNNSGLLDIVLHLNWRININIDKSKLQRTLKIITYECGFCNNLLNTNFHKKIG